MVIRSFSDRPFFSQNLFAKKNNNNINRRSHIIFLTTQLGSLHLKSNKKYSTQFNEKNSRKKLTNKKSLQKNSTENSLQK